MMGLVYTVRNDITFHQHYNTSKIADLYNNSTTKLKEAHPILYNSLVHYLSKIPVTQTNLLLIPVGVLYQMITNTYLVIDPNAIKVFGTTMKYANSTIPIPKESSRLPSSTKEISNWINSILGKQKLI